MILQLHELWVQIALLSFACNYMFLFQKYSYACN